MALHWTEAISYEKKRIGKRVTMQERKEHLSHKDLNSNLTEKIVSCLWAYISSYRFSKISDVKSSASCSDKY